MPTEPLQPPTPRASLRSQLGGVLVISIPAAILICVMLRTGGASQPILAGGIATAAFLALGLLHQVGASNAAAHKSASPLYLIAVLVLWINTSDYQDRFIQTAMGTLLCVPLSLFVFQEYLFTGRGGLRRARTLVRRLANKTDWPADLESCKTLSEVKALREALKENAEPVLVLLMHPNPQVRIAALASLEFRPTWRKGQAQKVLQAAKFATEPPVRVAALMALANVDDLGLAPTIAVYLRDATPDVRKAAAEALLWDAESRWPHIRREIRAALADARCLEDGPLPCRGSLPKAAIVDLTTWCGEAGSIAQRATLTLVVHYRRELNENPDPELVDHLSRRIADNQIPSSLRVEIAHLLVDADCIDPRVWQRLIEAGQPSALRLLAAGAILREGPDEKALEALRDVARVPNRGIALQVAAIIQRCLRIDMGLPLGVRLPDSTSKLAAEIARRVRDWVEGKSQTPAEEHHPRRSRTGISRPLPRSSGENPRRRI